MIRLRRRLEGLRDTRRTNAEKIQQLKNSISNLTAERNRIEKTLQSTNDEIRREEDETKNLKNLTDEMKFEDIVDGGKVGDIDSKLCVLFSNAR